ncbi:hypothetical protein DB48_15075 [Shewanella sp. cp20]|nr:hypothetical protein DB48_15075 [Shewanella sp. cp20]
MYQESLTPLRVRLFLCLYHFSTALSLIDVVHYITIALPCIKAIQNAAKMNAKDQQGLVMLVVVLAQILTLAIGYRLFLNCVLA